MTLLRDGEQFLTLFEAAAFLGITPRLLLEVCGEGDLFIGFSFHWARDYMLFHQCDLEVFHKVLNEDYTDGSECLHCHAPAADWGNWNGGWGTPLCKGCVKNILVEAEDSLSGIKIRYPIHTDGDIYRALSPDEKKLYDEDPQILDRVSIPQQQNASQEEQS